MCAARKRLRTAKLCLQHNPHIKVQWSVFSQSHLLLLIYCVSKGPAPKGRGFSLSRAPRGQQSERHRLCPCALRLQICICKSGCCCCWSMWDGEGFGERLRGSYRDHMTWQWWMDGSRGGCPPVTPAWGTNQISPHPQGIRDKIFPYLRACLLYCHTWMNLPNLPEQTKQINTRSLQQKW
jgi:hypothetical protein